MSKKQCVLFCTHKNDESVKEHYNQLKTQIGERADIWFCYNHQYGEVAEYDNIFYYDEKSVNTQGFRLHNYYWNASNKPFYGHNYELILLSFATQHQEYDYFWVIDYDVLFTGDWNIVFDKCDKDDAELICSNLWLNYGIDICFKIWTPYLKLDTNNLWHGFLTVFRISKIFVNTLIQIYDKGDFGFYEVMIPSVAKHLNLKISTFNDMGFVVGDKQGDHECSNGCRKWLKSECVHKNKIYHCVK